MDPENCTVFPENSLAYSTEPVDHLHQYRNAHHAVQGYFALLEGIRGETGIDPARPVVDSTPNYSRLHVDRLKKAALVSAFCGAARHPGVGKRRWIVWHKIRFREHRYRDIDGVDSSTVGDWVTATDTAVDRELEGRGLLIGGDVQRFVRYSIEQGWI